MFDKKNYLVTAIVVILAVTCFNAVTNSDAATENGYVTVEIGWNEDYVNNGHDSAARIALAETDMGQQFDSIKSANTAFEHLFSWKGGSYHGEFRDSDGTLKITYPGVHPLAYGSGTYIPEVNKQPVSSLKFIVHGSVPAGGESISFGYSGQKSTTIDSVVLKGVDRAYVSGATSLYASQFIYNGQFTISNIEFENIQRIDIAGKPIDTTNEECPNTLTMTVTDCVFHSRLYSITHEDYTYNIVKNIVRNKFLSPEGTSAYAIMIQGHASELNIRDNLIDGFRGINIHEDISNNPPKLNAVVDGNTFMNNTNPKGCVQFTCADSITFTNNQMIGIQGNAIWIFPTDRSGQVNTIDISNNEIEADYLIYNQQDDVGIQSANNVLDIANPGKCLAFDSSSNVIGEIGSDVIINVKPAEPESPPLTWDDDDELPFFPPVYNEPEKDDESAKVVACAAAVVVIALATLFLMADMRKR